MSVSISGFRFPARILRAGACLAMIALLGLQAGCDSGEDATTQANGSPSSVESSQPANSPPPTQQNGADAGEPSGGVDDAEPESGNDYHSFSTPDQIITRHLDWDVDVDFSARILSGKATFDIERIDPLADTLILDTRALTISSVNAEPDGNALKWKMGESHEALGEALEITIPSDVNRVTVTYQTSPEASGLQWLEPVQTAGGEQPFLFSQAQAIHARSFIPLQDSPQVRITYKAHISTPPNLLAVMSAANEPNTPLDGEYDFDMPQPIPSYLIAIGVGDLEFQAMSDRTGVYAESSLVGPAANEFSDTEEMMEVAETLFGPYRWGRYDLLILPPSFPFGGMENPRLSFITPTVIAGDRSLVALIAHELAHSWSGNLVTNATWRDLWLNEGFTVYLESRIMEALFGDDRKRMEDVLGYQSLQEDLADLDEGDQRLTPDLRGRDPDDVFSQVPYEKGRLLLVYLEKAFNRNTFDLFLRDYFDKFAFQSLTTEEFVDYLDEHLLSKYPGKVSREDLEVWISQPGVPDAAILPQSDAFTNVDALRAQWEAGDTAAAELPAAEWTVHEWLYFLNNMSDDLAAEKLIELDNAHQLTSSQNAEIAHSWLRLAIAHQYQPAMPRLREYLSSIGRRKLIVPLYTDLMAVDWGQPIAREVYAAARPGYHPLAQNTLDAVVTDGD